LFNLFVDDFYFAAITDTTVCDHLRAPELFKASINATEKGKHLMGYKCQNYEKFKVSACCWIALHFFYLDYVW